MAELAHGRANDGLADGFEPLSEGGVMLPCDHGWHEQPISISNTKPKSGKPPYSYTLSASPENTIPPVSKTSKDGWIREEVKLSDTIEKGKEISLKVEVKDSDGKSSVLEDKTAKLIVTE